MNTLKAEKRDTSIKAKKLRREGFVTGNVFGRQIEGSILLKMEKKNVEQMLKTEEKGSQIMLDVGGESYDVLIKEIQYNSLRNRVDEIDFQALVSNEKVHSVAEITFANHDKIIGGVFQEDVSEIPFKAYPSALVGRIRVDVGNMRIGDILRVKDLDIAKNKDIDLMIDPETVVASVFASHIDVPDETKDEATSEEKK